MASQKEIQSRIKSIKNTKKVTKAMEMVAAAKMRRAIEAVLRTREYANLSWDTILRLSEISSDHPLLLGKKSIALNKKENERAKAAIVLFSSNRGLCGGFNSSILKKVNLFLKEYEAKNIDLVLIGKKGIAVHNQLGCEVIAEFKKPDIAGGIEDVMPAARMMINEYLEGKYLKVAVAYTDFINATSQVPRIKQILPVDTSAIDENLGEIEEKETKEGPSAGAQEIKESKSNKSEYIFEPNPREVLDDMVSRFIEIQLFQALLESNASEHSARMTAMHQATDAASDMISELTLSYNKARQASITQEIAEIGAGVESMGNQ